QQYFLNAVKPSCRVCDRLAILPGDQHVNVTANCLGGGQRLVGRILEGFVVVLGDEKRGHFQSTPASSLSLLTNSAADPTFTPDLRPGGSAVLSTCSRGLTSTPYASGAFSSIGFFFAFMMFGSEA